MTRFDIVFVADLRFEGGSSTALAVEIREAARAGLKTAMLFVKGPLLGAAFPVHPHLSAVLEQGLTQRLDPEMETHSDLVLLHHPSIMENRVTRRLRLATERLVVVLHHPAFDRKGARQYDIDRIVANCRASFDADVLLAPVSSVVRDSLPRLLPKGASVLDRDWVNLIRLDDWPQRKAGHPAEPVVIGRHARPHRQKWPDLAEAAMSAYPVDRRFRIRILGGGGFLEEMYGPLPANWEVLPFETEGVAQFLGGLDFYVYFHSDAWSEAFGRTILEALAVGLVVILPEHFRELFGEAAVYAEPAGVQAVIARFVDNPDRFAAQSRRARKFVEEHHDASLFAPRIAALFDLPRKDGAAPVTPMPPLPVKPVLFVSSNGIGMGHLMQQMAIAQRLGPDLKPVFATMSYAMKIAADAGYHTHFIPHHLALDAKVSDWNDILADEMFDLLTHLRPRVLAYDSTAIFSGIVSALEMHPDIFSIWVRRPMWRESHRHLLDAANHFDAVIEPGELAADFDHGPTRALRDDAYLVPPVLQLAPAERLERSAARRFLDVADGVRVVALQLGSSANFDMGPVREAVIWSVLERPDTLVLELRSPIRASFTDDAPRHERHRIVELFPAFRYSRAFDAMVAAPGYNTFHENILGCVPSIFVPNEADEMDLQLNRARWAELSGMGWTLRRDHDLPHVGELVEKLLDPDEQAAIVARCRRIPWTNGADDIARYIQDHARLVRTDWDITRAV
ncbi:MAG: glycosyltransferase [Rhizobiaceae bacterium]|nr:glycosyltransferase [Rhizobiaceae bacterium]